MPLTILCISSYEKGHDFMRECKEQGCRVLLLTSESLKDAYWPKDSIDETFYIHDRNKEWDMKDVIYGVSYVARKEKIDRIIALDDFDVERAAALREHLRIPGMGDTTARYFRDKLAMRTQAASRGIPVPEFLHVLNHEEIGLFAKQVEFPLIVKARLLAGAHGLKKVNNEEELWNRINELGEEQSFFLIERFVPGNIYHVDSIVYENEVHFALASRYGKPPFEVAHSGRVFTSRTVLRGSEIEQKLLELNEKVIKAMGLPRGVSHTEFIEANEVLQDSDTGGENLPAGDKAIYFLETSARVGGAHIADLVEAASGINLWREWAKIEIQRGIGNYEYPQVKNNYAGIIQSLAKQEWPDLTNYDDPEVIWKLNKRFHAGLIIRSDNPERIEELLNNYTERFYDDFFATQPMKEKPGD